ncbi:MAG: hypothetical protein ACOC38_04020 [Promethearchaeia archaeon]
MWSSISNDEFSSVSDWDTIIEFIYEEQDDKDEVHEITIMQQTPVRRNNHFKERIELDTTTSNGKE